MNKLMISWGIDENGVEHASCYEHEFLVEEVVGGRTGEQIVSFKAAWENEYQEIARTQKGSGISGLLIRGYLDWFLKENTFVIENIMGSDLVRVFDIESNMTVESLPKKEAQQLVHHLNCPYLKWEKKDV